MNNMQFKKVWAMPLLHAVLTLLGLLTLLLATGYWHLIAWAAISVPLLVIVQKTWLKRKV